MSLKHCAHAIAVSEWAMRSVWQEEAQFIHQKTTLHSQRMAKMSNSEML